MLSSLNTNSSRKEIIYKWLLSGLASGNWRKGKMKTMPWIMFAKRSVPSALLLLQCHYRLNWCYVSYLFRANSILNFILFVPVPWQLGGCGGGDSGSCDVRSIEWFHHDMSPASPRVEKCHWVTWPDLSVPANTPRDRSKYPGSLVWPRGLAQS